LKASGGIILQLEGYFQYKNNKFFKKHTLLPPPGEVLRSLNYCGLKGLYIMSHFAAVCQSIQHPVTKDKLFDMIEKDRWRPAASVHPSQGSDRELMPPPPLP
jgi:hypothetical protein